MRLHSSIPLLRIVPDDTKFDFMRFRRISFPISAALSIVAILLFFFHGLNFGIDFVGGTLIEVQSKSGPADLAKMRATLGGLGLGDVQLQEFGSPTDVLIRVAQQPGGEQAQQAAINKVREALGDGVEYRRVEVVGPRVSTELLAKSTIGLGLAIFAILIYLWFRFEWQFALGAMIANVHDLVLTIGYMSLTQIDFDLSSIAALLTILGYSLNDTVVIYDRIREMLRRYKRMSMPELLNVSVNSTLSRSIITHVTVTLALLALLLVRRPCHPQLHRHHDFRRGAGRHLYLGVHRRPDPDLSRRRDRPHGSGRAGGTHPGAQIRRPGREQACRAKLAPMQDAFAHCEALVRAADKDRFLATLFAPAEHRRGLFALYAFNVEVSRVREVVREPLSGEIRLQWWSEVLGGEGRGEVAANPVAAALTAAMARYALPRERLAALLEARRFDLYDEPMATLAALDGYAEGTASNLIALAAQILNGGRDAGIGALAHHAGLAYAIAGLLKALPTHAARGQLYVPVELLERHGARAADGRRRQGHARVARGAGRAAADRPPASRAGAGARRRGAARRDPGAAGAGAGRGDAHADGAARLRAVRTGRDRAMAAAMADLAGGTAAGADVRLITPRRRRGRRRRSTARDRRARAGTAPASSPRSSRCRAAVDPALP